MQALFALILAAGGRGQNFATPTMDWLLSLGSIAEVALSPVSGALLVEVDGFAGDEKTKRLYFVARVGAKPQLLADTGKAFAPEWSPNGKAFAYLRDDGLHQDSLHDNGGVAQLVVREVGGAARVMTHGKRPIEEFSWIDEAHVALSYNKRVGCTHACLDEPEVDPPTAYVADELLFRHWDSWTAGKRIVLAELTLATGALRQVSSDDSDAPPYQLLEPRDFAAGAGGRWLAYGVAPVKDAAVSNDLDLVLLDRASGARRVISDSRGIDDVPRFSPDGRLIAYRSMARAQAEADRAVLWLYDVNAQTRRPLSDALDRSIKELAWSPDSRFVYFTADDDGGQSLYRVAATGGEVSRLRWAPALELFAVTSTHIFVTLGSPLSGGALTALAHDKPDEGALVADFNAGISLAKAPTFEPIHVRARDGTALQAWLTRPANAGKNLRTVVLLHGGPQGAWDGGFTSRWNATLFAGLGYLVIQPNPRGSMGFGQKFTDAVTRHWGGVPYDDIMDVIDDVVRRGDANPAAMCAAGTSYGAYMVDWMAGHTNRFKCLISHAGLFDLTQDYGTTDELWADEWDIGGVPWENPQGYAEYSPSRFVTQMKTPMLLTHGELDYRVFQSQSLSLFTALRRQGVPARLVIFPGENHWILGAKAKRVWWQEVSAWLGHYLP
jgi:dipeptidyl aminopeptidase/acylaminoacyl peptidase